MVKLFKDLTSPKDIHDHNYIITFGKYHGDTLGDILKKDPTYLKWVNEETDQLDMVDDLLDDIYGSCELEELELDFNREYKWS